MAVCGVHRIGSKSHGNRSAETLANAHLIASAPRLYAALEKAQELFDAAFDSPKLISRDWRAQVRVEMDAALAAARGEET